MGDEGPTHRSVEESRKTNLGTTLAVQNRALLTILKRVEEGGAEGDGLGSGTSGGNSVVRNTRRRDHCRQVLTDQPGSLGRLFSERMCTRLPTPAYGSAPEVVPDPCLALERHGGWQGQETYGHLAWMTAKLLRSIWHGNLSEASDRGASLLTVLDQLRESNGDTRLSMVIALEEPPPVSLFSPGQASIIAGTGWSPLLPDEWASTMLGHVKEVEQMQTRTAAQTPTEKRSYWQRQKQKQKQKDAEGGGKGRGKGKKDEE